MKGRNPNVGRRAIGSPIARSGIKPPSRTGRASGSVVGTGVNAKSGATPEYKPGMAKNNDNGPSQIDQWVKQAPEPFRNSQPTANPRSYSTSSNVSPRGYEATAGQRAGSGGYGSQPRSNFPAASAGGALGQENGKVIGKSQPRRVGNVFNQPKGSSAGGFKGRGGAPSFYGR